MSVKCVIACQIFMQFNGSPTEEWRIEFEIGDMYTSHKHAEKKLMTKRRKKRRFFVKIFAKHLLDKQTKWTKKLMLMTIEIGCRKRVDSANSHTHSAILQNRSVFVIGLVIDIKTFKMDATFHVFLSNRYKND